jgi:hypothetical protein
MILKPFKYYRLTQLAIILLCSIIASTIWAFSLVISEAEIHGMLALTFPYQIRMGNNQIRLSDPEPQFYEASQEVGIALNILLKDQNSGQISKARTLVRGGVHFDNQQQQLQLVKPTIVSLDWDNKSANVNQGVVKQLTRIVGQELPIIILVDIKQLTGGTLMPTLSGIKVKKQGIEVSF